MGEEIEIRESKELAQDLKASKKQSCGSDSQPFSIIAQAFIEHLLCTRPHTGGCLTAKHIALHQLEQWSHSKLLQVMMPDGNSPRHGEMGEQLETGESS